MRLWITVKKIFGSLLNIKPEERSKVLLLSIAFFLIIGSYTLSKELKDLVFGYTVGFDYRPLAKVLSMVIFIPLIFFYSRLVDLLRRHHLLNFYVLFYAIVGLVFAYYLGHPTIGLPNTNESPYRIFGWLFYFFIEGYSAFVIGVFWAFINSISSPDEAKNNYPLIIAGSKVGGIVVSVLALILLFINSINLSSMHHVFNQQLILGLASVLLLGVPFVINKLLNIIPKKDLHGYEAAYLEAKSKIKLKPKTNKKVKGVGAIKSMLSGLILLFKHPYVSGIFALRFFYEVVTQVINLDRLIFSKESAANTTAMNISLLNQALIVHAVSFVVVLIGTRPIIKYLGERRSLMLIPIVVGGSMFLYLFSPSYLTSVIAFVIARAMNFVFTTPLVETLYIPTVKDIKFKSKSWIDGFGSKFAKMSGSSFNWFGKGLSESTQWFAKSGLFSVIILLWFGVSYLLGKKYDYAIEHNEVIGSGKSKKEQDD